MDVEDDNDSLMPPRAATLEDLVELCRELNLRGAKYVVVGGFAGGGLFEGNHGCVASCGHIS
ncbi:hypothetical protein BH11VER1_BH11VER1_39390 [soil metagenome]